MKTLFVILLSLILYSCSSEPEKSDGQVTEAEKVYNEAKQLVESNRFLLAVEKLNYLKTNYPYSYFNKAADLLLADIYFEQESYEEATASYLLYKELHPRDKKIPYVLFRIAESYFKQVPSTIDRDLSSAEKAIQYYQLLLSKYPGSEFVKGAEDKIIQCENMMREKEKYIADFYFKTEVFLAAKIRYLRIMQLYKKEPSAKDIVHHSMLRFVESTYWLSEYKKCIQYGYDLKSSLPDVMKPKLDDIIKKCRKKVEV